MRLSQNAQIFIGAILGVLFGVLLSSLPSESIFLKRSLHICGLLGSVFINLLKMILIPLVFVSITVGIANLRAHAQMDRVWKTSLLYYASTTAIAVLLGLIVVNVFRPGVGLEVSAFDTSASAVNLQELTLTDFFSNLLSNLFMNPMAAMANGQVLGTIVFAMFMGIALVVSGDKSTTVLNFFNELFTLIMLIVSWIMKILPIGIFALLAKLIATQDVSIMTVMGKFIAVVIGVTLFHGFVVLPLILMFLTATNPKDFYIAIKDALVTAFSTSSSSATLPVTYNCVTKNLKVDKDIAGFVLPLGSTINMDGTAMYEAIAALFVANLAGIDLNIIQQLTVFFMAIVASVGAPGIPSAGMVTMVMVLQSVGLPIEAIALLIPIDRPLDAIRTMVNVNGDCIGCKVVEKYSVR